MHQSALKALTTKFKEVADGLVYIAPPDAGKRILETRTPTTSFTHEDDGKLEALKHLLLSKNKWSEKWSERYLTTKLEDVWHRIVELLSTNELEGDVEKLVNEYESFSQKLTVLVPIVGLSMQIERLEIGKVVFHKERAAFTEKYSDKCRQIILGNEAYSVPQRESILAKFETEYLAPMKSLVCAEFQVVAESYKAEELALVATREALDLLRFFVLFRERANERIRFGIQGEATNKPRHTVALAEGVRSHYKGSMVNWPFVIDDDAVVAMRRIEIFVLSDLLCKAVPSEFEIALLDAVHWLSSGQAQYERVNAILNFMTALETLIKPAANEPIVALISENVALLLGDNLDDRRTIRERLRQLYSVRSKLSHGESKDVTDIDFAHLIQIARNTAVRLIRRRAEFENVQALRTWLDERKLGGPENPQGIPDTRE